MLQKRVFFDGPFWSRIDVSQLTTQQAQVFVVMYDGRWRTLDEIHRTMPGSSKESVARRLRQFREKSLGGHDVLSRPRQDSVAWEYRLVVNPGADVSWILDKIEPRQLRA